jgi:hypothetical protein
VKPGNVLLDRRGAVKLGDLGIAGVLGTARTASAAFSGTVAHAAPEVLEAGRASVASDLYSLGSTLFEALTGHPPFAGEADESWARMALRAIRQPVPDLRTVGVPDDVAAFVERLMAKRPEDRPASAADVREACRTLEVGAPLPAERPAVAERVDAAPAPAPAPTAEPVRWRVVPVPATAPEVGGMTTASGIGPGRRRRPVLVVGGLAAAIAIVIGVTAAARGDRYDVAGASPATTVPAPVPAPAKAPTTATAPPATTATTATAANNPSATTAAPATDAPTSTAPATAAVPTTVPPATAAPTTTTTAAAPAVPDVVGRTYLDAAGTLEAAGYGTRLLPTPWCHQDRDGRVVSQDPGAGAAVAGGDVVVAVCAYVAPSAGR